MRSTSLSLAYRMRPAGRAGTSPLIVLLHGLGSNESDLFALAPLLDPRFVVASVRAPHSLGPNAFSWFSIDFTADGLTIDVQQGRHSCTMVVTFVMELSDMLHIDRSSVFLMGFSQGAMLAAAISLARPDLLAGTALMSGALVPDLADVPASTESLEGFPIVQVHGRWDTVLPVELGRESRRRLAALPVDLEYAEFDMGHEVTSESFALVQGWLTTRLDLSHPNA